jgi:hypothetical protein
MGHEFQKGKGGVRLRLHWTQNRHNTTVWTDFKQGRKYQPHYCLCQRYTETDPTGILSPKHSRMSGDNKLGFFRANSLARHLLQGKLDSCVVAMDKTNRIELVRDMRPLWEQRDKYYHNRGPKPKFWDEIGEKLKVSREY